MIFLPPLIDAAATRSSDLHRRRDVGMSKTGTKFGAIAAPRDTAPHSGQIDCAKHVADRKLLLLLPPLAEES
jgi:hypothetical protein